MKNDLLGGTSPFIRHYGDVINDVQKYSYKDASILKELCDNNILNLTNCRRANSILLNLIQFDNIPYLEKSVFSTLPGLAGHGSALGRIRPGLDADTLKLF